MAENHYMISDASKQVNVETHVLRYWEEELGLEIPRNELGHRYYTEDLIKLFCRIRDLKDSGYQLKAIKMILPKLDQLADEDLDFLTVLSEEMNRRVLTEETSAKPSSADESTQKSSASIISLRESLPMETSEQKMEFLQNMFATALTNALNQQMNQFVTQSSQLIGEQVSNRLTHDVSIHMELQEEQMEEHFKQVDELLRQRQQIYSETAMTRQSPKKGLRLPWKRKN
ncbi:MAG: MerR family transcriptional regulator [Lachnospiraceae bacterium]